MATVKIMVTQQDIDDVPRQGWKFGHPCYGPVSSALCRTLGLEMQNTQIDGWVNPNELDWYDREKDISGHMKLPDKVIETIHMFDAGKDIQPFEF